MAKKTVHLAVKVVYDDDVTNPEEIGYALDHLMDAAIEMWGLPRELGEETRVQGFFPPRDIA